MDDSSWQSSANMPGHPAFTASKRDNSHVDSGSKLSNTVSKFFVCIKKCVQSTLTAAVVLTVLIQCRER